MRVALISDLHGNELAFNAVLADIARQGVDQIICLGDVATLGPRPRDVLGRLAELRCVCILGNHDEFMLD
ncbi:MAG: metallophosphoesterase family protein, partial [Polyangiaceae bacterium]